jgi:hypothetical protein
VAVRELNLHVQVAGLPEVRAILLASLDLLAAVDDLGQTAPRELRDAAGVLRASFAPRAPEPPRVRKRTR